MTLLPDLERVLVEAIQRRAASAPLNTRRRQRSRARIIALTAVAVGSLSAVAAAAGLLGYPAPDAHRQLPILGTSRSTALAAYRGKPLIVTFYASWCLPCRYEAKLVNQLGEKLRAAGTGAVVLIGYRDKAVDAQAFAAQAHLTLPILGDPTGAVATAYGIPGIPATFVLDADGRITSESLGTSSQAKLDAEVAHALRAGGP